MAPTPPSSARTGWQQAPPYVGESSWPFPDHELPRIDRLGSNLFACSFSLMKLLPARRILERAEADGRIGPGSRIVETTSGTFGLALAMVCAVRQYRLSLVSDPVIDERLGRRLRQLGAELDIVRSPDPLTGYQGARLTKLHEILDRYPRAYWTDQYGNPENPGSYARLVDFLLSRLPLVDCVVGTVGTGGSTAGTAIHLRTTFPESLLIGVDTCRSVLFGQSNGPRLLRGLGNSIVPPNLDHSLFDFVSWIPAPFAFAATRRLHRGHGLFMGGTSGAAYLVAEWWAQAHPDALVVVLLPDEGHRYVDTIYNDDWLAQVPGALESLPRAPIEVDRPGEDEAAWTWLHWGRRTLEAALTH